jgi:hypothetical protein
MRTVDEAFDDGQEWERMTGLEVEDALIKTYVPEANTMSREDALALAIQRDEEFAESFEDNMDLSDEDWEKVQEMRDEMMNDEEVTDE